MGRAATMDPLGPVTLADRAILGPVAAVAGAIAALNVIGILASVAPMLRASEVGVTDMPIGNAATPEFTEQFAQITAAHYESVAITLANPPSDVRWLLWGESVASSLLAIGVCAALAWLCIRTIQRRPFGQSVPAALAVVAAVVLVAGLAREYAHDAARAAVVRELGPESTAGATAAVPDGYEGFVTVFDTSLVPVGWALALAVLAVVFRLGARMQRDTERLV